MRFDLHGMNVIISRVGMIRFNDLGAVYNNIIYCIKYIYINKIKSFLSSEIIMIRL